MIIHRVEHNRRRLRMHVHVCESAPERARGLLLRRQPDAATAWLLAPCRAVHTFGLLYPIDVLFCGDDGRILRIARRVAPCRVVRDARAAQVWELRAGVADRLGLVPGDRIAPC